MRILHVADLHLRCLDWVAAEARKYDLLAIAGDLQDGFADIPLLEQTRLCTDWLLSIKTPTMACSGNHDHWASPRGKVDPDADAVWLKRLRGQGQIIGVDGDVVVFGGLTFRVNGWTQLPGSEGKTDILITHAPPSGCSCAISRDDRDAGSPDLWDAIRMNPPAVILSGHIHEPRRTWCLWPPVGLRSYVFVPGYSESREVPDYWCIDTAKRTAKHGQRGATVAVAAFA